MVWLGLIKTCFDKKNIPSLFNMFTFCCPIKLIKAYNIKVPRRALALPHFLSYWVYPIHIWASSSSVDLPISSNFNRGPQPYSTKF